MQVRRLQLTFVVSLAATSLLTTGLLALASGAPGQHSVAAIPARECSAGAVVSAEPGVVYLGAETLVTSIITGTCYPYDTPIDITILVDQSNSMTKGEPGGGQNDTPGATPGSQPTQGNIDVTAPAPIVPPPGTKPPPRPTEDPGPAPTLLAGLAPGAGGPAGPDQVVLTPTLPPRQTPGPSPTEGTTHPPGESPTPSGNIDQPTASSIRRDVTEPPGDEDLIRVVQEAIREFLDEMEGDIKGGRYRVGIVAFNDRAIELVPLTDDVTRLRSRLSRLRGQGNTRVDLGLSAATRQLVGVGIRGRQDLDHKKLVILFSDGKFDRRTTARLRTREEIDIVTVAVGRTADRAAMRQLASSPQYALEVRDQKGLVTLVRTFKPNQRAVTMPEMTVEDIVAVNMALVADSMVPPVSRAPDARTMQWDFAPPSFPITITYRVRPQEPGVHVVSEKAHATWKDSLGRTGDLPFPPVEVEVLALPTPTATTVPSATPTVEAPPTATLIPTPEPGELYLPRLYKDPEPVPTKKCVPAEQTVDVVLAIDISTSMNEPAPGGRSKLQWAIDAATEFVTKMKDQDQVAVVGFASSATLASPLTNDKARVVSALQSLVGSAVQGTRIDLGLSYARDELQSIRHQAGHTSAVVLVTDGLQTGGGGNDAVRAEAAQLRAASITLVTIGIGDDVDSALLREIATKPEYYYPAPTADQLLDIYREIAQYIACP